MQRQRPAYRLMLFAYFTAILSLLGIISGVHPPRQKGRANSG